MEINEWIKAISEVGVLICIAGIFLYTAIRVINIFLDNLSGKLKSKKHDNLIDLRTKLSEEIQKLIDNFLNQQNGDKVQVVEFSNSVTSVAYLPFRYMTCTYEVCRFGVPPTRQRIDRLSTSLFTPFFQILRTQSWCKLDATNPGSIVCGAMRDLMIANEDKYALFAMIETTKGKSLGYVSLKKSEEFTESDVTEILTLADQLSVLLGAADV